MAVIVAGDSWGTVAVPVIEEHPFTMFFFAGTLVTVGLTIMNLIPFQYGFSESKEGGSRTSASEEAPGLGVRSPLLLALSGWLWPSVEKLKRKERRAQLMMHRKVERKRKRLQRRATKWQQRRRTKGQRFNGPRPTWVRWMKRRLIESNAKSEGCGLSHGLTKRITDATQIMNSTVCGLIRDGFQIAKLVGMFVEARLTVTVSCWLGCFFEVGTEEEHAVEQVKRKVGQLRGGMPGQSAPERQERMAKASRGNVEKVEGLWNTVKVGKQGPWNAFMIVKKLRKQDWSGQKPEAKVEACEDTEEAPVIYRQKVCMLNGRVARVDEDGQVHWELQEVTKESAVWVRPQPELHDVDAEEIWTKVGGAGKLRRLEQAFAERQGGEDRPAAHKRQRSKTPPWHRQHTGDDEEEEEAEGAGTTVPLPPWKSAKGAAAPSAVTPPWRTKRSKSTKEDTPRDCWRAGAVAGEAADAEMPEEGSDGASAGEEEARASEAAEAGP